MNLSHHKLRDRDRRDQATVRAGSDLRARYDRAMDLARGYEAMGDRIDAERFYQQADHFRRLLNHKAASV